MQVMVLWWCWYHLFTLVCIRYGQHSSSTAAAAYINFTSIDRVSGESQVFPINHRDSYTFVCELLDHVTTWDAIIMVWRRWAGHTSSTSLRIRTNYGMPSSFCPLPPRLLESSTSQSFYGIFMADDLSYGYHTQQWPQQQQQQQCQVILTLPPQQTDSTGMWYDSIMCDLIYNI